MHIVCPHCRTSYAINPATFGDAGRTVRCSRCKETWLAHPEDLVSVEAMTPSLADAAGSGTDPYAAGWGDAAAGGDAEGDDSPLVDSPSISADWPTGDGQGEESWSSLAQDDSDIGQDEMPPARRSLLRRLLRPSLALRLPSGPPVSLSTTCAAMAALVLAMMIWRIDVVRLLPQTAAFYKMVGLQVNLRGLSFRDVKLSTENADGKPVLVVEGTIVGQTRKTVELPRLHFVVRDAHGTEIYAWNAMLEQATLQPGDKAWFRSRLASPPSEGRSVDVRFFNQRDLATGNS
jgi:predicted Zn finger-like uncharacterized protein